MKSTSAKLAWLALAGVAVVGLLALVGCQNQHPDVKQAVYSALSQNQLRSVVVSQDRGKGEIRLSGIVGSPEQKANAERLAQQAASGYTITNNIEVQSAGLEGLVKSAQKDAKLDSAIEDQYKASLKESKKLKKAGIQYSASNGTLYLKGSVKTEKEKQEAEDLAKKVPQVQHVVNDIAVKSS